MLIIVDNCQYRCCVWRHMPLLRPAAGAVKQQKNSKLKLYMPVFVAYMTNKN